MGFGINQASDLLNLIVFGPSSGIVRDFLDSVAEKIFPLKKNPKYIPPLNKKEIKLIDKNCPCDRFTVFIDIKTTWSRNFETGIDYENLKTTEGTFTFEIKNRQAPIKGVVIKSSPPEGIGGVPLNSDDYIVTYYYLESSHCQNINGVYSPVDVIENYLTIHKQFYIGDELNTKGQKKFSYRVTDILDIRTEKTGSGGNCEKPFGRDYKGQPRRDNFFDYPPPASPTPASPSAPPPAPRKPDGDPGTGGGNSGNKNPVSRNNNFNFNYNNFSNQFNNTFNFHFNFNNNFDISRPASPRENLKNNEKPRKKEEEENKKLPSQKPSSESKILKKLCQQFTANYNIIEAKEPEIEGTYFQEDIKPQIASGEGLEGIYSLLKGLSLQIENSQKSIIKCIPELQSPTDLVPGLCPLDLDNPENKEQKLIREDGQESDIQEIILENVGLFSPERNLKYLPSFLVSKYQEWSILAQRENLKYCDKNDIDAIAILPSDYEIRGKQQTQLFIRWTELENYPVLKMGDSTWQSIVPNPIDNLDWENHFEDLRWYRGEQYAILKYEGIRGNTKGFFLNKAAADAYFDEILTLTKLSERNGSSRYYSDRTDMKLKPREVLIRPYRAYLARINEEGGAEILACLSPKDSNNSAGNGSSGGDSSSPI